MATGSLVLARSLAALVRYPVRATDLLLFEWLWRKSTNNEIAAIASLHSDSRGGQMAFVLLSA